jgi:hypothetical protein
VLLGNTLQFVEIKRMTMFVPSPKIVQSPLAYNMKYHLHLMLQLEYPIQWVETPSVQTSHNVNLEITPTFLGQQLKIVNAQNVQLELTELMAFHALIV